MKIGIIGAGGRMGRAIIEEIISIDPAMLGACVEHAKHPNLGEDAGLLVGSKKLGIKLSANLQDAIRNSDVLINFSTPKETVYALQHSAKADVANVIGTTGLTEKDKKSVESYAQKTAVMLSANMSVGVTLLSHMVETASRTLDERFDIEVLEMHHRLKKDAPSGTALLLGEAAAKGRNTSLKKKGHLSREGITGERPVGEIGFATLRGGDVVGDHTVMFAGDGERIEFTHKASNRKIFAKGAVRAALWIYKKKPGLYSMKDVLGL